jgi:hypothetical protein
MDLYDVGKNENTFKKKNQSASELDKLTNLNFKHERKAAEMLSTIMKMILKTQK